MNKRRRPLQRRVTVRLPLTEWIPGSIALEYVHDRLPGYSGLSVEKLLHHAVVEQQVEIRYKNRRSGIIYGLDGQTKRPTIEDLFFKRHSLEVWADEVAPSGPEQDAGKGQSTAKFGADEEALNPKSADSMKKMIIGMAMAKYGYDPTAERNKATAEITADLVRLGLSLDPDTVRRWLREAADCLPRTDVADL